MIIVIFVAEQASVWIGKPVVHAVEQVDTQLANFASMASFPSVEHAQYVKGPVTQ
jgi:hypothetical protein